MDKLAIVGYGKMGKIIEKYAKDFNFQVCAIIDLFLTIKSHKVS